MKDRTLKRDDVQNVLTLTTDVVRESLLKGDDVLWVDLCTFTWKKKAKTKKEAAYYAEHPEEQIGDSVRVEPVEILDGLNVSGGLIKELKPKRVKKVKEE